MKSKLEVRIFSFISGEWQENTIETNNIKECYFIEDLFSYCLTGKIIFNDVRGLLDVGGLISGTEIWINYGDGVINNSDNFIKTDLKFKIYKINKVTPNRSNTFDNQSNDTLIELILVEPHFFRLIGQKYSRSWGSETVRNDSLSRTIKISTIIENILEKMVKWDINQIDIPLDISNSSNKIEFLMPYWTPLQGLNWLSNRLSNNSNDYGICIYNSIDWYTDSGSYGNSWGSAMKIRFLNTLLSNNELLKDPGNGIFTLESGLSYDYNRILSFNLSGTDMFNNRQLRGSQQLGYDFNRKKLINEKFQYSQGANTNNTLADKVTTLGAWTLLQSSNNIEQNDIEYDRLIDTETNINLTGEFDETMIKNITYNKWIKSYCMQNTMSITVKGHESRRCGKMIEIKWPPTDSIRSSYNPNLHGNYLIKSVTHHFSESNKPFYKQKLSLIKNAYNYDNITDNMLYKSQHRNTINNRNTLGN